MPQRLRDVLYAGATGILALAFFLTWLWRAEHQVQRHSENLLRAVCQKDWPRFAEFIDADYQDQWGNNRALVSQRTRELFRYLRNVSITTGHPSIEVEQGKANWRAPLAINGAESEAMALVKERINNLRTPFELEWRHRSGKPWDWKLVAVRNADLSIPPEFQ